MSEDMIGKLCVWAARLDTVIVCVHEIDEDGKLGWTQTPNSLHVHTAPALPD